MTSLKRRLTGGTLVVLAATGLTACGAATREHRRAAPQSPLASFQLQAVGSPDAADAPTWTEYGAKPLHRTLTVLALGVYDRGHQPLTLLGVRQAHPIPGLTFRTELATTTPGFSGFPLQVRAGAPVAQFGLHATFRPVDGYVLKPDPSGEQGDLSPSLVVTAVAAEAKVFQLGDWVVTYRLGSGTHTQAFVTSGEFCAGAYVCPRFG